MLENAFEPSNHACFHALCEKTVSRLQVIRRFHVSCEKTLSRLQVARRFSISCPKTLSGLQAINTLKLLRRLINLTTKKVRKSHKKLNLNNVNLNTSICIVKK